MAMTKTEEQTIRNVIARLKEPNCGCATDKNKSLGDIGTVPGRDPHANAVMSRIYLETWIIGALECLLPGAGHDPKLGERLSRK